MTDTESIGTFVVSLFIVGMIGVGFIAWELDRTINKKIDELGKAMGYTWKEDIVKKWEKNETP